MTRFDKAGINFGRRLRRAILALLQSAARSHHEVSSEYYRFPPF
jgi:hypothetical protein